MRSKKIIDWLKVLFIPVAYALALRLAFGASVFRYLFNVMTIGFLIGVPFGMGYLAVWLSPMEWIKRRGRRIQGQHRSTGSFFLSSLEHYMQFLPTRYEAYTYIDIRAAPSTIWENVVRVRAIDEKQDHGRLTRWLGFPRPIRAELDYAGVGGSRQAIFSKGLVFREVVKEYQPEKKMHFSIAADPHEIPSTTMNKHVVIGGDYFNVLDGTYELEKLAEGSYRLHLYSHFVLNTHFNFYASWWADLIMKDIQENILQVIQTRCQG